MPRSPLLVLGTARSGTTLLAKMLDAHRDVAVASDPFFMLFRMLRNAIVAADSRVPEGSFAASTPLQDYYFRDDQLAVMQAMLDGSMDLACDQQQWDATLEQRKVRMGYECPDLVPLLGQMHGETFRQLLASGLELIATGRGKQGASYVGVKEVWLIEYVLPLLRTFPDAKVLLITRDPRGVVASMLTIKDESARAHIVSYLRHWRKFMAFLSYYQSLGLVGKSLFHVRFEDFIREPAQHSEDICRFLGIGMDPAMLDPEKLLDYATGKPWRGNASSEVAAAGVSAAFADTWRNALDLQTIALCDFVAGGDMQLCGYAPESTRQDITLVPQALRSAMADERRVHNWRSDSGDLPCEFGLELFRHSLFDLAADEPDPATVRRVFLFAEAWQALQTGQRVTCNGMTF